MTNDVENPGSGLRQAHKCSGVTPVNSIKPSHLFNLSTAWISNSVEQKLKEQFI
jgi:hypothetical protein